MLAIVFYCSGKEPQGVSKACYPEKKRSPLGFDPLPANIDFLRDPTQLTYPL